ncbi:hypothetical protein NE237_019409 [Protea cynaroides]|uniref:beta-galactosidase n=1 Tax=Protea cynaroides TaxID=273540 RepID=A0A9Q0QPY5_9MAGN|nr:hypothetical protein NE237_019409 [Protea cynaroides]
MKIVGHVLLSLFVVVFAVIIVMKVVGSAHGSHDNGSCTIETSILLNNGMNNVSLLSVMVGLPDSGAYLERRVTGLQKVMIQSKDKADSQDFTDYSWGYNVGLLGEQLQIYNDEGSNKVQWSNIGNSTQPLPLTWYKTTFNAPSGDDPLVLNLGTMGKGEAWVNGQSIGRYWSSFLIPNGNSSQTLYHVPRSFLKPSGNLLLLLEEFGGDPLRITLETVSISRVCGYVTESHLFPVTPRVELMSNRGRLTGQHDRRPKVQLQCPPGKVISKIVFASFGNPSGGCESENPILGSCHSSNTRVVVEGACLGKKLCSISLSNRSFDRDPCPGISKALSVVVECISKDLDDPWSNLI